mmetsp:Transcript_3722/g.6704  ORF Transcript_3722/g.6704 Transcript_3722/m.6704 type:complete len:198 (+) Transcript_3722:55-648(+)
MFDLDDLEHKDPSPMEVTFEINGNAYSMRCPNVDMTPHAVAKKWEQDWGVTYASRLRFVGIADSGPRTLNAREDVLPFAPAVVKLEGPGSVLTAVAVALRQRGGGPAGKAGGYGSPDAKSAPAKKAGLGPVQRSVFRQHQAEIQRQVADPEMSDVAHARRVREEFLRDAERRRKEEADRWAREEAEWAANRRRSRAN